MKRLMFIAVCSMLFLVMADLASAKEEGSASADWVQVVPGATHSIGLKADGTVWTWGSNEYGDRLIIQVRKNEKGTLLELQKCKT